MSGNVVIGFTTDSYLMLDLDFKRPEPLWKWAKKYARRYHLGSVLMMKTSSSTQVDLNGNELNNYCIVFGQPLPWQEIVNHVEEAYEARIVNKEFRDMRYLGNITERVNRKNRRISYPNVHSYFRNGNKEGCMEYLRWWKWNKDVG